MYEFHHDVTEIAVHVGVVHLDDVRVMEHASRMGFIEKQLAESLPLFALVDVLRVSDFDRDQPVREWIVG